MDTHDKDLIRSAYLALRAAQEVIRAAAAKTLGPASPHAFTIDGKPLGDLGELVAGLEFNLTPLPTGTKGIDAMTVSGKSVQVKATAGGGSVDIPGNDDTPDFLVVVSFDKKTGDWDYVYRSIALPVWNIATSPVYPTVAVRLRKLSEMQDGLPIELALLPANFE